MAFTKKKSEEEEDIQMELVTEILRLNRDNEKETYSPRKSQPSQRSNGPNTSINRELIKDSKIRLYAPIGKTRVLQRIRNQIKKVNEEIENEEKAQVERMKKHHAVEFIYDAQGEILGVKNVQGD